MDRVYSWLESSTGHVSSYTNRIEKQTHCFTWQRTNRTHKFGYLRFGAMTIKLFTQNTPNRKQSYRHLFHLRWLIPFEITPWPASAQKCRYISKTDCKTDYISWGQIYAEIFLWIWINVSYEMPTNYWPLYDSHSSQFSNELFHDAHEIFIDISRANWLFEQLLLVSKRSASSTIALTSKDSTISIRSQSLVYKPHARIVLILWVHSKLFKGITIMTMNWTYTVMCILWDK